MSRVTSAVVWGVATVLCFFMLGRGIWALQQPWRSTGDKLFALAFFTALTGVATYKLLVAFFPAAFRLGSPFSENIAYGAVSLVFVVGAAFVYLRGDGSTRETSTAIAGVLFFGGGAVMFFIRARRL
jgi:hypothetical protein